MAIYFDALDASYHLPGLVLWEQLVKLSSPWQLIFIHLIHDFIFLQSLSPVIPIIFFFFLVPLSYVYLIVVNPPYLPFYLKFCSRTCLRSIYCLCTDHYVSIITFEMSSFVHSYPWKHWVHDALCYQVHWVDMIPFSSVSFCSFLLFGAFMWSDLFLCPPYDCLALFPDRVVYIVYHQYYTLISSFCFNPLTIIG